MASDVDVIMALGEGDVDVIMALRDEEGYVIMVLGVSNVVSDVVPVIMTRWVVSDIDHHDS